MVGQGSVKAVGIEMVGAPPVKGDWCLAALEKKSMSALSPEGRFLLGVGETGDAYCMMFKDQRGADFVAVLRIGEHVAQALVYSSVQDELYVVDECELCPCCARKFLPTMQ